MADGIYRIGVVGAGSLKGKELAEELAESMLAAAQVTLLDEEELMGQFSIAGDDLGVIQKLEDDSFKRMDFVFFAGAPALTEQQWMNARRAGASIVDMTYVLEGQPEVLVRSPLVEAAIAAGDLSARRSPDLSTTALVAAHPAAVMLALVAARLKHAMPLAYLAATVLEPASEYGRAAMDELHHQTVNLLSFQTLPQEQYDTQVAFNLTPGFGEEAKVSLARAERRIASHYALLAAGRLPELSLQLVHAPVFHGYTISALMELEQPSTVSAVEAALSAMPLELMSEGTEVPSNLSASGQEKIQVRVRLADTAGKRFWIWLAADNLKLAAQNAIACAMELRKLRPQGKIQ